MAIPASHIVDVQPRVIAGGSNDLEFNGLFFSRNEMISATTGVLSFSSAAAVGDYFGLASEEYAVAQTYFTGYTNKSTAPRAILFALRVDGPIAAWVRGGKNTTTLQEFRKVANGSIILSVDGVTASYDGIDLSTANSFSDVAERIATAVDDDSDGPKLQLTYSSQTGAFTIISLSPGNNSTVEFPEDGATGTGLASLMNFRQEDGAIISEGAAAPLSVNEQMAKVRNVTENFVTFTTMWEADTDEIMEWATWAAANYGWLYLPYTTQPGTVMQDTATDPASMLQAGEYDHTAIVYGPRIYATFVMGAIASISWLRLNGTITLAFKRQPGLAGFVLSESEAAVLEAKNCNYFGNFATRNAEFVFLYNGVMSNSTYTFIDPYINSIWLNNRLTVAIMDGLVNSGRVPYNERGYTLIRAWMQDSVNEGLNNAAIEPGITLSEAQKSQIFNEAGLDITDELTTQGYFLQILDPGATVRAQRQTPIINLWYTYGGSVQRIEVASTAIL